MHRLPFPPQNRFRWFSRAAIVGLAALLLVAFVQPAWAAKNVIIMVADGSGFNTWKATSMYQGKLGKQVYDSDGWVKLACSTYPLNLSTKPKGTGVQDRTLIYDPVKAWSAVPVIEMRTITESSATEEEEEEESAADKTGDKKSDDKKTSDKTADKSSSTTKAKTKTKTIKVRTFTGYVWLKKTYTDSAASATALATGVKTYNNAINWTDCKEPLRDKTIAEIAKKAGKNAGVITTVPWSHATPAGLGGAHNLSRNNYSAIANEMLAAPYLDVIMGAGHPEFTDDGTPPKKKLNYNYVGGQATWSKLKAGTHAAGWKLIETKDDFEALAKGPAPAAKILGTAQVGSTLQQKRGKGKETEPFSYPRNRNVPTLATMTRGAINRLSTNSQGFYLMIEGGAVDWANHSRQPARMIEEMSDFVKAVEAVVDWIETKSSWDDTLLILTADHETGCLWGPDSDTVAFQPLVDHGAGHLPGMKHNHDGHNNALVPLFARGPGSERFAGMIVGCDTTAAEKQGISGRYVDNTGIFKVMEAECRANGAREKK